jgi:hypothetical protein
MWRCGSTYVWSRFRAAENTYCYYEPLHHGLSRLTADKLVTYAPEVFEAHSHPVLVKPHFAEFEPLLSNQGVQAFQKRFAYKRYLLQEGDKDDALKKYVETKCRF